jgi:HK97 family phage major capsid protein
MTHRIDRILRAVCATPWAILPEKLDAICEFLTLRANGQRFTAAEVQARIGEGRRDAPAQPGGIAVLPLYGVISHRIHMVEDISGPGGTSTEKFGQQLDAALADPSVSAIVLDIDSPGGSVEGVEELAAKILGARGQKRITAVANSLAASAAYWIASAADELVVTPSGMLGSIGVFTVHTDVSEAAADAGLKFTLISAGKYKVEGNMYEPLSEEARAATQEMVDEYYGAFVRGVAKGRDVSVSDVRQGFGQGRVVPARKALALGMADRVATLEQVLAKLGASPSTARSARAIAPTERIAARTGGAFVPGDPDLERQLNDGLDALARERGVVQTSARPAAAGEAAAPYMVPILEPAPKAKEQAMSDNDTAAQNGAVPAESREQKLSRLADLHGMTARLSHWIINGATVESVQQEIQSHYAGRDRATAVSSQAPALSVGLPNEAKRLFTSLGDQLQSIANHYSGRGTDPRLLAAATGGSATVGGDGGFLIQKEYSTDLLKDGFDEGILARQCSSQEIGANADSLEVAYIEETSRATGSRWGGVQVYRVAEADTVTASKPKLGKWELRLEDMMGLAYMTERLLQDAGAMQGVFEEAFTTEFGFKLDDEIFRGNGVGQCLGVLNAPATVSQAKESGQLADTVVAENIVNMWSRVHPRSRARGSWYYNAELDPQLLTMQIGTGTSAQLVWMRPTGISEAPYGSIYGRPAIPLEYASAKGDVGDICFLDLTQYKLITKGGINQEESIHVRFVNNERAFRWVARVNGMPKLKSALTPYKGAATLSPFVTLAAR